MIRPGDPVRTALFGVVEIRKVFMDESAARAEGYYYDAAAYRVNFFGAVEPVPYKVLGKDQGLLEHEFAAVLPREDKR